MAERTGKGVDLRSIATPPCAEGEDRRRQVLERKAQLEQERHGRLVHKLTLVEDRRQAVIEMRKKRAQEQSARLNERLEKVNLKRKEKEEMDRLKRESAMKRAEVNSERASQMKRRHTLPRSMSVHVASSSRDKSAPRQTNGDLQHVGHTSRFSSNRLSTPGDMSSSVQRSKSAKYSSATSLTSSNKHVPTKSDNKPSFSASSSSLARSRSHRSVNSNSNSNSKSSAEPNASTSASSSVRTSAESKVKFSNVECKTEVTDKAVNVRRTQSVSVKRRPIPPKTQTPIAPAPAPKTQTPIAPAPIPKTPLTSTPKPHSRPKTPKPELAPTPKPAQPETPAETTEASSAEIEFKKKLAEKRKMARENQLKKESEAMRVVYDSVSEVANEAKVEVKKEQAEAEDNVEPTEESEQVSESASDKLTEAEDGGESEDPTVAETDEDKEERKRREREIKVAQRMKQLEEEREKERIKLQLEAEAKLKNEEMERERVAREEELERQRKQEEEERAARKAKLDAIMAKARVGNTTLSRAVATSIVTSHVHKDEEERVTDEELTSPGVSRAVERQDSLEPFSSEQNTKSELYVDPSKEDESSLQSKTSTVEHESPSGSKIASPADLENLSPVPERHKAVVDNENVNFEQVIDLNDNEEQPESRNVDGCSKVLTLQKSGDGDSNAEFRESNGVNSVTNDLDNAEHSQFPF